MSSLAKYFLKVLADRIDGRLQDGADERFVLKGVPQWLLDLIEQELSGESLHLRSGGSVLVVLLDEEAGAVLPDSAAPSSGRYNIDRVTEIRNHFEGNWVAICPHGSELNSSNEHTTSDLGAILEDVLDHSISCLFPLWIRKFVSI